MCIFLSLTGFLLWPEYDCCDRAFLSRSESSLVFPLHHVVTVRRNLLWVRGNHALFTPLNPNKQTNRCCCYTCWQANIRAKRRAEFRQQLQERPTEDVSEAAFFDPRVSLRPSVRGRRAFNFHEPGKFQQVAARMRTKAQLEKLQVRLAGRLVWLFFLYLTPFYSQLTGVRIGHYCINTS